MSREWFDEVRIPKQTLHWEVVGFRRIPGRPRMNWRDVAKKDVQRMGLTWEGLKRQLKTDIRGVNVWPYASVMLDESRSRSSLVIFQPSAIDLFQLWTLCGRTSHRTDTDCFIGNV